jgi:hypothetical protein
MDSKPFNFNPIRAFAERGRRRRAALFAGEAARPNPAKCDKQHSQAL